MQRSCDCSGNHIQDIGFDPLIFDYSGGLESEGDLL